MIQQRNRQVGQRQTGIELHDLLVIPRPDAAHEDVGQHRRGEPQLAGQDTGNVDHNGVATHDGGELHDVPFLELAVLHRHIRRTEIRQALQHLELPDRRPRRLIVDRDTLGRFQLFGPFDVDRRGERRTGPHHRRLGMTGRHAGRADGERHQSGAKYTHLDFLFGCNRAGLIDAVQGEVEDVVVAQHAGCRALAVVTLERA